MPHLKVPAPLRSNSPARTESVPAPMSAVSESVSPGEPTPGSTPDRGQRPPTRAVPGSSRPSFLNECDPELNQRELGATGAIRIPTPPLTPCLTLRRPLSFLRRLLRFMAIRASGSRARTRRHFGTSRISRLT